MSTLNGCVTAAWKRFSIAALALAALVLASLLLCGALAPGAQAAVRGTDVETAGDGALLLGVEGTFSTATKSVALARVNAIRKEACEEGVTLSNGTKLSSSDYVPIKWSSDLEWIAQTRAAEASVVLSHTRPNGMSCFSCVHDGVKSWGEVLAWNYSGMLQGIEQWYAEKYDLVNNTGGETGHYEQMINPTNTYLGLGTFRPASGGWACTAGEFSFATSLNEDEVGVAGACVQVVEFDGSYFAGAAVSGEAVTVGKTRRYKMQATLTTGDAVSFLGTVSWKSSNTSVATVSSAGKVTGKKTGRVKITATAATGQSASTTITVGKGTQSITAKKKTVSKSYKAASSGALKAAKTLMVKKAFGLSGNKGKLSYKKTSGNAKITVSSAGKVKVRKGLRRGTYKVTIKVTAKATKACKAATKTLTLKVKVG